MVKIQFILGAVALAGVANAGVIKARDCSFLWAAAEGDTCDSLSFMFGISAEQFTLWNSGVKCSAPLTVGKEYCLLWDGPDPTPPAASTTRTSSTTKAPTTTTTSKSTTTTKAPTTTTTTKVPSGPQPTQDGIAANCNKWHQAVSGDYCAKLVDQYKTFSLDQFIAWNPAVGKDCSGMWLGYQYCVGVPGAATPTQGPTGPQPTQTGIASNCQRYHQAVSGDTCAKIVDKYKTFNLDNFITWNPAVGKDCSGLWLGYQYCIGIPGTPTTPPVSTKPSPTQDGISSKCNKYHLVASDNICQTIASQYGISVSSFYSWNPAVGNTCASLWLGYYVCVGVSA